jgi:uncharacterized protein (UPF0548 family)
VLRLRRPSPETLARLLSAARQASPTYAEVGATTAAAPPAGYRHDNYKIDLGRGGKVFPAAVEALQGWQAQTGAGVEVVPHGARVADGETVLLLIRVGVFWATAPCRVVYVVDEPERFAFAYGTLPGHPEVGEAAFSISRDEEGTVTFLVTSFSRTVDPVARLAAPFTRRLQTRVTRRYLSALREAVS